MLRYVCAQAPQRSYRFAISRGVVCAAVGLSLSACSIRLNNPITAASRISSAGSGATTTTVAASTCDPLSAVSVAAVYPTSGANWNDYVRNSGAGSTPYDRSDTACDGTETGRLTEVCIHGGERRRVSLAPLTSCTGITATDSLGAFDWECVVLSGTATVVSRGLKPGKGLRDLIDPAGTSWRTNSVSVSRSGCGSPIMTTVAATWWTNTVSLLPSNPLSTDLGQTLSSASRIYTLDSSRATSGYNINADKIAVVTLGSSQLSYSGRANANCTNAGEFSDPGGNNRVIICQGSQKFTWIEVSATAIPSAGSSAQRGVDLTGGQFTRVHGSTLVRATAFGLYSSGHVGGWLSSSQVTGTSAGDNITIRDASHRWILSDTLTSNASATGVYIVQDNSGTVIARLNAQNNGGSNLSYRADDNSGTVGMTDQTATQVVSASGGGYDILTSNNGIHQRRHTHLGLLTVNSSTVGLGYFWTQTLTASKIVSMNQGNVTIEVSGTTDSYLSQIHALQSSGAIGIDSSTNVQIRGISQSGAGGGCAVSGNTSVELDGSCNSGAGTATAPTTGVSGTNAWVGRLSTGDTTNPSDDTAGAATYAVSLNFALFDNAFRGWGRQGSAFPAANNRGRCSTGTCNIWDWSLRSADSTLRALFGAATITDGAACPAAVSGADSSVRLTDQQTSANTYLLHAFEVVGDNIGDENALCESNEVCIYAPNQGPYQGHGDPYAQRCVFNDGVISGVTMLGYSTNGY